MRRENAVRVDLVNVRPRLWDELVDFHAELLPTQRGHCIYFCGIAQQDRYHALLATWNSFLWAAEEPSECL